MADDLPIFGSLAPGAFTTPLDPSKPSGMSPEAFLRSLLQPTLPDVSVSATGGEGPQSSPRFKGRVSVPLFGGQVGLHGNYQAVQGLPPDVGGMLSFMKRF